MDTQETGAFVGEAKERIERVAEASPPVADLERGLEPANASGGTPSSRDHLPKLTHAVLQTAVYSIYDTRKCSGSLRLCNSR